MNKKCSRCDLEKDRSLYSKDKQKKDGLYPACNDCLKSVNNPRIPDDTIKICCACKLPKLAKEFRRAKARIDGVQPCCGLCQDSRNMMARFGFDRDTYLEMNLKQNGVCKICGKSSKTKQLGIDHCHTTGKVRGLLCDKCNLGIGYFNDSIESLENAIKYLKEDS